MLSSMLSRQASTHVFSKGLFLNILLLLLLCTALFFWQLDAYSLFDETEAKQAEIARQMWVRNDWITPFYNGEIYFDKPILLHWLIALGFPIFGLSEWAVRLPSALAATGLVLSTWLFTAQFTNSRIALLAATMLAANPSTFALGRTGQHDMLLVFFMTAGLYCWYLGYSTGHRWAYLAYFALTELAVMAKGPLGAVLSIMAIGFFVLWVGRWREQLTIIPWKWGLLIFAGLTLPWYALVILINGQEFFYNFFVYNNLTRFVEVNQNQAGPWYYYIPIILIDFFPWIALSPVGLLGIGKWRSFGMGKWQHKSRRQQLPLFLLIWFFSVLIFMTVAATKLPWYVYPGFPALAILCAQMWDQQIVQPDRWLKLNLCLIGVAYLLTAIGFAVIPYLLPDEPVVDEIVQTGTVGLWVGLYASAAVLIWLSALHQKVLRVWGIGLLVFGITAMTLVNPVLPILDRQVLSGRLQPMAIVLQQEVCATCPPTLLATLVASRPSLNFYSQISTFQRFHYRYQIQLQLGQLTEPERFMLITTDKDLNRIGLDLTGYELAYVAKDFKLFIFPAGSDLALRTIGIPR